MAEKANYNKDLQTAIELANEQESRIRGIEEQLSYEPEDERNEQMENVEKLEQAIQTYTRLRNKSNMMVEEQEEYTEAVKTIIDSKDFVIDLYEDVMANQIAQAYGIKNPESEERKNLGQNCSWWFFRRWKNLYINAFGKRYL